MSELKKQIQELDKKFTKLIQLNETILKENNFLKDKIKDAKIEIEELNNKNRLLEDSVQSLKVANALLGSEEYKRDTKLKINNLIREINHCIAQLSRE